MTQQNRRHRVRYECPGHIRFLTWACYKHMPLLRGAGARDCLLKQIMTARSVCGFKLYAWAIMPDHVHLLLRPELDVSDVSMILRTIKEPSARAILAQWRLQNARILDRLVSPRGTTHFWERGGGYDRNIYSREEFVEKYAYIHSNPVRAGLVKHDADWAWSSAFADRSRVSEECMPDPLPPL